MKQEEIIGEGGVKIIKVYSTYTDSQKRATKKYRENNRAKVNEQRKVYYQKRKDSDPSFLEYKRKKAREYYQSKKAKNEVKVEPEVLPTPEPVPEPTPEPVPEPTPEPVQKPEKKKRPKTANKKNNKK